MPNIKINKQLSRPDGGKVASGSVATADPEMISKTLTIKFPIKLYLNEAAIGEKKAIPMVTNFSYREIVKVCNQKEWDAMNDDANAGALVSGWMQDAIDEKLGDGYTVILK